MLITCMMLSLKFAYEVVSSEKNRFLWPGFLNTGLAKLWQARRYWLCGLFLCRFLRLVGCCAIRGGKMRQVAGWFFVWREGLAAAGRLIGEW